VSGAYYKESGLFNSNALSQYNSNIDLTRYNLRSNIDLDVTSTTLLRVDISGQYLATNYPGTGTSTILQLATTAPPYLFPPVYSDGTVADHPRPSNNRVNPYNLLTNSGYTNEFRSNIQSRIDLEQKLDVLTKGLMAKVSASYDYSGQYTVSTGKSFNSYFATGRNADGTLKYQQIKTGTGNVFDNGTSLAATKNTYLEASLNYARMFNNVHDVTGLLLTYRKESQPSSQRLPYRKQAYVARVTYAYDRRYSVELNTGITGSENFSQDFRYGVFPAAGVSWFASHEHFYPQALKNVVSTLKFRASYGISGNDQLIDPATGQVIRFPYRGTFASGPGTSLGYTGGGNAGPSYGGLIEGRFSFPSLTWEKEKKKNLGIDLGLFGDKLNITADYFDNYRYDILVLRQTVSGATGFRQNPAQNYGIVTNHGIDGSATYQQKIGKSTIGFRGNFTFARNKIIQIDEIPQPYSWMNQTGNRLNMNNLFVADRLFTEADFDITTNPVDGSKMYNLQSKYAPQTYFGPVLPGDIKYQNISGSGTINQYDQTRYIGNPSTPEITYGFGFSYSYKGFSVNAFFAGIANCSTVLGGSNPQGFFPFNYSVDEASLRTIAQNRWTAANPSQNVLFPRIRTTGFPNNTAASTWWLRDASFLRLKNVEIGYEFPKEMIQKLKINRLKLYALGYNLLTWDHIKYWDPEQGNANAGLNYPQSRTFTFGMEVGL
jgi:TonB-linked SusC/RagA family outer membrane protein